MMQTLEKLSPRPARFAVFFILLVYIFATSTAKPLSSMDKSEADVVSVQNGDLDSNHRVVIPEDAGIPGVPAENILDQPDIKRSHRYPRYIVRFHRKCYKNKFGLCQNIGAWKTAIRKEEIGMEDD